MSEVLGSPGESLGDATRTLMEARLGHDFSAVRVHRDRRAGESAEAVGGEAYAAGRHIVFGEGGYRPDTESGRALIAHELAHVVQQDTVAGHAGGLRVADEDGPLEREARGAETAGRPEVIARSALAVHRRPVPYISKVTVNLTPPQSAALEWTGTPPQDAPGADSFTVSTGKGYGDPDDPPGTCTRDCCSDPMTQCAPPWNRPDKVGACCTYYGSGYWTGTPLEEHNGWRWWTPIQPYYSSRGIALHQHTEVTGQPIGHGCVRMDDDNAKRIHDFSNGRRTAVTVVGRAAPVACDESRHCATTGALAPGDEEARLAAAEERPAVPGLEGLLT